jgi:hypothetical protein
VIGIAELFAEYSRPDEFHVQAQLELFAWRRNTSNRESARKSMANRYATDEAFRERHKRSVLTRQKARYANDPVFRERQRERMRQRYAAKRAEQRAA